jgi:hypothetical protein
MVPRGTRNPHDRRRLFLQDHKTGHEFAEKQFRIDERNRRTRDYLLQHLGVVPDAVRVIERAMPTVQQVDTVRHILRTDCLLPSRAAGLRGDQMH